MARRKRGELFEKLVASIERILGFEDGRKVEYSKRLRHLHTGKFRQFDVVLTFPLGHHTFVTAIECKDFSRPVDVKEVEAFITKINGCPVNRGCMVANSFTADALAVAYANKISCFDLKETKHSDWLRPTWTRQTLCIEKLIVTATHEESLKEDGSCVAFDKDCTQVPDRVFYNHARVLLQLGWPGDERTRVATLVVRGKRYTLVNLMSGLINDTEDVVLTVFYHWIQQEEPFTIHSYRVGDELVQIASADVIIDHSPSEREHVKLILRKGDDTPYVVREPRADDDGKGVRKAEPFQGRWD